MRVREIMTEKPTTAHPNNSVADALELMNIGGFHHLPIMSSNNHLIGIITERDCRIALQVASIDDVSLSDSDLARSVRVRDVMSSAPITATPDEDVVQAAARMYENQVNSLPVLLEETLVGIMTVSDVLVAFIQLAQTMPGLG